MMTVARRFLVAFPVIIGLAACGSSSTTTVTATTSPTTGTTTSPAPTTTQTTTGSAAADQRVARDAQLKLSDFPSGWEQKDRTQEAKAWAACQGVDAAKAAASARQTSPDFAERNHTYAGNFAYIYADVPTATRAFGELSSEHTRTCLGDALAKYLPGQVREGAEIGKITTGQVAMQPVGDERTLTRLTVPLKANGLNVDVTLDLVFVRVGRGIAGLQFQDVLSPFDETLRTRLTTTAVDRLKTALAQPA